jgi:hypothetical protein
METSTTIAFTSLAIALLSFIWNIFFGYGKLIARMDIMQNDITWLKASFAELKMKIERLEVEFHKLEIPINIAEQRKP